MLAICAGTVLMAGCGDKMQEQAGTAARTDLPKANRVATPATPADAAYINGHVYTVGGDSDRAEAFAIRDRRFIAVGTLQEVEPFIGSMTKVVDLHGRMVMPGIHDVHVHPMDAGLKELYDCGFPFSLTLDEILGTVKGCAAGIPKGEWVRGGQWATELLESSRAPHKSMLDAVAPDHPVFLIDSTVHGAWVNSAGLAALGITRETPDPNGGVIVRDRDSGEPTGVLLDNAAYLAMRQLPPYSPEQYQEALYWSVAQLNKVGVTAIKDAQVDGSTLHAYCGLARTGRLQAWVATSLAWKASWTETREQELENIASRGGCRSAIINTAFIKIFLDGIPPSRTAAFLDPYLADERYEPGYSGKLIHAPAELAGDVVDLDAQGLTIKIHATGDRAVRIALDAFEAARRANGHSRQRHEIAHAEAIHPEDLPRFQRLGVTAEMSPILWYPSSLVDAMEKVLGRERVHHWWPIRALRESGALVVYGSDWPSVVPSPSPWPGIEAMVTRRDPYGAHDGELWPEQAIDLASAIEIFTRAGAAAMYLEDHTGSIEAGKSADFIVLDRNLFEILPEAIGDTQVLRTVVRGETVYEAGEFED
jgi:hypothetical protein